MDIDQCTRTCLIYKYTDLICDANLNIHMYIKIDIFIYVYSKDNFVINTCIHTYIRSIYDKIVTAIQIDR